MKSLQIILSNPKYLAPAMVFSSLNIWFGVWAIYIPSIKDKLHLNNSDLGFALFFLSLGVFIIFPFATKIINYFNLGRTTWLSVVFSSVVALFPMLAPNYTLLCASLLIFGMAQGITDIAMNTLVSEIEQEDGKNFMSAAHGFYSLGGILAGLTSFFIPFIGSPFLHMLIMVIVVFILNLTIRKHYLNRVSAPRQDQKINPKLIRPLLLLGLVGFISMGSEGAVIDWGGLYLKEVTLAPEYLVGLGFIAFSTAMTLGRFFGDWASERLGSRKIMVFGSLIALLGYGFILIEVTYCAILGFLCVGLGFSVIMPELFRIGGKVKGIEPSQGIAFIAGTGYAGFLTGPVVLGYLAEEYALQFSFWTLLCCVILILFITLTLRSR